MSFNRTVHIIGCSSFTLVSEQVWNLFCRHVFCFELTLHPTEGHWIEATERVHFYWGKEHQNQNLLDFFLTTLYPIKNPIAPHPLPYPPSSPLSPPLSTAKTLFSHHLMLNRVLLKYSPFIFALFSSMLKGNTPAVLV